MQPRSLPVSLNACRHQRSPRGMTGRLFDVAAPPPLARSFPTPQRHALPFTPCASLRLLLFSVYTHNTHDLTDGSTPMQRTRGVVHPLLSFVRQMPGGDGCFSLTLEPAGKRAQPHT